MLVQFLLITDLEMSQPIWLRMVIRCPLSSSRNLNRAVAVLNQVLHILLGLINPDTRNPKPPP